MVPPRHRSRGLGTSNAAAWEIGMARIPVFVEEDDGAPVRPLLALVMDPSGRIRGSAMAHPDTPEIALEEALAQAIHHPEGDCSPGPPRRVVVPNALLIEKLQQLLPEVPIQQGPTPLLEEAIEALWEHARSERPPGETLAIGSYLTADVTPEVVEGFFVAAAALYERQPWRVFPGNGALFQVSSTALGISGWVGSVLGQQGENYGVLLFDSIAAYERFVDLAELAERQGRPPLDGFPRQRVLNYEPRDAMPRALLQEIESHGWPLAPGDAYPTAMLVDPDLVLAPPTRADLRQLEAVAWALVRWIDAEPDLRGSWDAGDVRRRRYRVSVQGEEVSVTIGVALAPVSPEPLPPEPTSRSGPPKAVPAKTEKVPAAMQEKVNNLMERIDGFCERHLDGEYRQLIHAAVAALARKRPSPLLTGREPSWCAGVVHAIGAANFLFDKTQTPHCKAPEIYAYFEVSPQTGQAHSKKVRDLLKIGYFSPRWTRPSRLDESPLAWMLEVNGFMVDIRTMPLEIQLQACAKGLIPYVPALRDRARPE